MPSSENGVCIPFSEWKKEDGKPWNYKGVNVIDCSKAIKYILRSFFGRTFDCPVVKVNAQNRAKFLRADNISIPSDNHVIEVVKTRGSTQSEIWVDEKHVADLTLEHISLTSSKLVMTMKPNIQIEIETAEIQRSVWSVLSPYSKSEDKDLGTFGPSVGEVIEKKGKKQFALKK